MAVEYDISSDVAVIKETGSVSQCARVTQMYSGQITYDDEAGSKFATATINGKSQRVMLCIAVNGTVNYDDVPSLYSTVDGHRCLNIVTPTETGTPDDVPSLYETVVIDGQNVRAVRCIMINKTPVYDSVSSTCTFTGDDGKTHTAQLVNKITGGSVQVIIKGTSPLNLPDAIANSLRYVKAFGGTEQNGTPTPTVPVDIITNNGALKAGQAVTIDPTRNYAYIYTSGSWSWSSDSYSIALPVEVGKNYKIDITNTDATVVGTIFRYCFTDEAPEDFKQGEVTPSPSSISGYDYWRGTPQDLSSVVVTATHPYLVIQFAAAFASSVIANYLTVADMSGVRVEGTQETIGVGNYYDSADGQGTFVSPSASGTTHVYKVIGKLQAGHYKIKITSGFEFIFQYKDTMEGTPTDYGNIGTWTTEEEFDIVDTSLFYGIAIRYPDNSAITPSDFNGTVTLMDTANTATAEMLLKVGDYQDVQSIIDGVVTRNVGVKVLDGTELITAASDNAYFSYTAEDKASGFISSVPLPVSTHFQTAPNTGTNSIPDNGIGASSTTSNKSIWFKMSAAENVTAFKAFLSDQYAAGTPVIIVYPLATPTTESVAGQALQVTDGDNVLEITQASLIGLELEAEYQAAVTLTVQEVQDANLDNNVEVTIS